MEDEKEIHICEQCGNEHDGSYGSGRFCSMSCKQKFIANKPGKVHKCKYCEKEFETSQKLGAHARCCKQNPNWQKAVQKISETAKQNTNIRNPIIHVKLICKECGNDYQLDVRQNQFENGDYKHFCSNSCARKYSGKCVNSENIKLGMKQSSNKKRIIKCCRCNKDIEVSGFVSNILCDECKNKQLINPTGKCAICGKDISVNRKTCCKEHEKQLRILSYKKTQQKYHRCGGMRDRGGYGKQGWYKGYHCDSSWELAWIIYQIDHNVEFKRNTKIKFPYQFEGKIYNYQPDFILNDGMYVEIKGYDSKRWQAKVNAFPTNLKLSIIYKEDIQFFIDYAIQKFGKDFVKVYEKHR